MRKRNHQKLYDAVVRLEEKGKLSPYSAFMVVALDQIIKSSKVTRGEREICWIFSNSEIRDAITNSWEKYEGKIKEFYDIVYTNSSYSYLITGDNDLEKRAMVIFRKVYPIYHRYDSCRRNNKRLYEKNMKKRLIQH